MSSLKHTLDDLSRYLEYYRDEGRGEIQVSPEVLAQFSGKLPGVGGKTAAAVQQARPISRPAVREDSMAKDRDDRSNSSSEIQSSDDKGLKAIALEVASCTKCSLHKTRTNVVPGQGAARPEVMFVGEAPGADEDLQGLAFVGRAGQLLTKMIEAMGYRREDVFIGNILKCRPPNNRQPAPDEMELCLPYLKAQIAVIKPKVIIALGATAVRGLTGLETGITKLRGKWLAFEGIELMPTYHPAYLLRNPPAKKDVWEDLKEVLRRLGRTPPPVKKK